MKTEFNASLVQFNAKWLDREKNVNRMVSFIEDEARNHQADLVVFPELATTGFIEPHADTEFNHRFYEQAETQDGPVARAISEAAARAKTHVVYGVARQHPTIPGVLYNSVVLVGPDGSTIGIHDKVHAALEEKNYFVSGNNVEVFETEIGKIGMQICYDMRFPELARVHALKGAEIIIGVWASFIQPGLVPSSSIVSRTSTRAMENGLFFLGCNRSGLEGNREFYGRSAICAPSGDALAESTTGDEEVIRARLDRGDVVKQRAYLTIFRDRRPEMYGLLTEQL